MFNLEQNLIASLNKSLTKPELEDLLLAISQRIDDAKEQNLDSALPGLERAHSLVKGLLRDKNE